jgi:hypothetical protein
VAGLSDPPLLLLSRPRLWRWRWFTRSDPLQRSIKRSGRFIGTEFARHFLELRGLLRSSHLAFHALKSKSNSAERKVLRSWIFAVLISGVTESSALASIQRGGFLRPITINASCFGGGANFSPPPRLIGGTSSGGFPVENSMCAAENACRRNLTSLFSGPGIAIPKNIPLVIHCRKYTCHFSPLPESFAAEKASSPIIFSAKYSVSGSLGANAISISPLPLASSAIKTFMLAGSIVRHWTSCFNFSCSRRAVSARSFASAICRRNDSAFASASPAALLASPARSLALAIPVSSMACSRLENMKTSPSPNNSPATPSVTSAAKNECLETHSGEDFRFSPHTPIATTSDATNSKYSPTSNHADAAASDRDTYHEESDHIQRVYLIAAVANISTGILLLIIGVRRLLRK